MAGSARSPNVSKQISTSPMRANCSFIARIVWGCAGSGVCSRDRAKPIERATQQSRHVHLGDPDALGDLVLEHVVLESELEDQPLALRERLEAARKRAAVLDHRIVAVLLADRAGQVVAVVLPAHLARGV